MSKADKLLMKWYKYQCENRTFIYEAYDDKCWANVDNEEYNEEYTTLIKDTIEYVKEKEAEYYDGLERLEYEEYLREKEEMEEEDEK